MLIIECKNRKEFQFPSKQSKVQCDWLVQIAIASCQTTFVHSNMNISTVSYPFHAHMCKGLTDRQCYLLLSFKCLFSNCGHAPNAMVMGTLRHKISTHPNPITREVNLATQSSASSADETRESGRTFQSLIVWGEEATFINICISNGDLGPWSTSPKDHGVVPGDVRTCSSDRW